MKRTLLVCILFIFLSCTTAQKPETSSLSYNHLEDIKLFLSTADEKVEGQVLSRLKSNGIESAQVKLSLQQIHQIPNGKPSGLQSNLKLNYQVAHPCG